MITLASMLLLGATVQTDPRNRYPEFFVQLAEESRFCSVDRTGATTNNTHALKLTFGRTANFVTGDHAEHRISIRKHHGFDADTSSISDGFDTFSGSPPDGSSPNDWICLTPQTLTPVVIFYCRETAQAAELPAGPIWIVVRDEADFGTGRKRGVYRLRIDLRKRVVTGDAPIDTRLVYGEPNDDGWYANANGMLRYVNFDPWVYKGGMFVGNMPMATGDGSGKARSQYWFDALTNDDQDYLQFMNFSVAHAGAPAMSTQNLPGTLNHKGAVRIGAWAGSEQQSFQGITESTATWENRWNLSGNAWPPSPDPETIPPGVLFNEWSTNSTMDYANFQLSSVSSTGTMTHNSNAFTKTVLALIEESTFTDARWRYFISKESAYNGWPSNSGFYSQDLKPRQWAAVLGYGEYTETTTSPDARRQK